MKPQDRLIIRSLADEHLLAEAKLRFVARGHVGPPSQPQFFRASSLIQLLAVAPNYKVELTGEIQWLA